MVFLSSTPFHYLHIYTLSNYKYNLQEYNYIWLTDNLSHRQFHNAHFSCSIDDLEIMWMQNVLTIGNSGRLKSYPDVYSFDQ